MADLSLHVVVTRDLLGLPDLDINDHASYYLSPTFLGGQVQWNRNQVTSPFMDGAVTTQRSRQMVNETVQLEVLGDGNAELKDNIDALILAVLQDSFELQVGVNNGAYRYQCETADYKLFWQGPRFMACQAQVELTIPRQPVALTGVA